MKMLERLVPRTCRPARPSTDELRTSVLRMLLSDLKYAQIEKRAALDDADSIQVVRRAIKKRKESIDLYEKGGRPDLVQKETAELKILEEFAPAELDETTVRKKVEEVIADLQATDKKDMGRVMKEVLSRYKGQIDGKVAQKIVSEKLGV